MHPWTTCLALVGAALIAVTGTVRAADATTPVVCGSSGCTPLPTATLQGLLTLPRALAPAESPAAQPFVLFRVAGDDATHEVLYVRRDRDVLLGFAEEGRWRVVPADDAALLADAASGTTPYPAPTADAPFAGLFASVEDGGGRGIALPATIAVFVVVAAGLAAWFAVTRR